MMVIFLMIASLLVKINGQSVYYITPTIGPITGGTYIFVAGSGFSPSVSYYCAFGQTYEEAYYFDSNTLYCFTPPFTSPSTVGVTIVIFPSNQQIGGPFNFQFAEPDSCFQTYSVCQAWGDPHFVPFCSPWSGYNNINYAFPIQEPLQNLNLVTSSDGRFVVHGHTTAAYNTGFGQGVCNLDSISISGTGSNFYPIGKIIVNFYPSGGGSPTVSVGGQSITSFPYVTNGVEVYDYYVIFPRGEIVEWDPSSANVYIFLPGNNYWKSVSGLCGHMDASVPYCTGSNGYPYGTSDLGLGICGSTWEVPSLKRSLTGIVPGNDTNPSPAPGNVPAPASGSVPAPASGNVPAPTSGNVPAPTSGNVPAPTSGNVPAPTSGNIPAPASGNNPAPASQNITAPSPAIIPAPETFNQTIVPFNFTGTPNTIITKATTAICNGIFGFLKDVCPKDKQENLPGYAATCIYDGTALSISAYSGISGGQPISSIESFFRDVANAEKLLSNVLSQSTFTTMVSSIKSASADCFFRNVTGLNATAPVFDVAAFTSLFVPKCAQYCGTIGGTCSGEVCQFELTLAELFSKYEESGASSIYLLNTSLVIMVMMIVSIFI